MSTLNIFVRLKLGLGKLRRFYLHTFNRPYVRRNLARRRGECRRCGTCCRLMYNCPFLDDSSEVTSCVRHGTRWFNCRIFPVDERDIEERNLVSRNGPCGYYFDPPMKKQRWLGLFLATELTFLAAAAEGRASDRAMHKAWEVEAAFRDRRMPGPARVLSGEFRLAEEGIECVERGELAVAVRSDGLGAPRSAARVEVWAEPLSGSSRSGERAAETFLSVRWRGREAGLRIDACGAEVFASAPGGARLASEARAVVGRYRLLAAFEDGLVSVSAGGVCAALREVFRTDDNAGPATEVVIASGPGQLVRAVRVSLRPERARPEALSRGDAAFLRGDIGEARELFLRAAADRLLRASDRAEAALKHGLALVQAAGWTDACPPAGDAAAEAARSLELAISLDPAGPWGERARGALARMALARGDALGALAIAHEIARYAGARIEDWALFASLVSGARAAPECSSGRGTAALQRIAERLEWVGAPPERLHWAWGELARSLDARAWHAEADAVRRRAERFFRPRPGRPGPASERPHESEGAPILLPMPERLRLEREKVRERGRVAQGADCRVRD